MTLPFVEVSHLASSSSFYSAILATLGLRFLAADREQTSSIGTITFGIPAGNAKSGSKQRKTLTDGRGGDDQQSGQPVLQIREVTHPFEPVKHSTLVLAAPSPAAVVEFHDAALTAEPWLYIENNDDRAHPGSSGLKPRLGLDGGETPRRATVRDLDGNTIQVVYMQPMSPRDHFGRVLEWTYNGSTHYSHSQSTYTRTRSKSYSHAITSARSSSSSISNNQSPFQPRQSPAKHGPNTVTAAEMTQRAADRADETDPVSVSPRQSSNNNGLSTTTVVGALLGVAAGAALTYGFVSNAAKERDRKPRQDFEPPNLPRRSTFPEKASSVHNMHQEERRKVYGDYPPKTSLRGGEYPYKALPSRAASAYEGMPFPDGYPFRQPMYKEPDYAPRKMSHPDDYPPRRLGYIEDESSEESEDERPPPVQYLTEYPHEENPWTEPSRARSRSRARSVAKSTAKSTARSTAAKSTTAKSTARSVAHSRARSPSRAPDDEEYETRSRHSSRHPQAEEVHEVYESRTRRSSRAPHDDGFDRRSRRASRPPPDDGFDTRSRRSSRPPLDDGPDTRNRRSSRPPVTEKARSVRSRSEAPTSRKSVVLADDHRSHAGSRHNGAPKSSHSRSRRATYDDERSYVSARSRPSSRAPRRSHRHEVEEEIPEAPEVPEVPEAPEVPRPFDRPMPRAPDYTTLRAPDPYQVPRGRIIHEHSRYPLTDEVPRAPEVYEVPEVPEVPEIPEIPEIPDIMPRSRAASKFSVPRMATGREYPNTGYSSKSQSYMSAKDIALPMSGVGSSHAAWEDDVVSVAPSDSISCIGSKMSRRSRKVR
ncbi:hypothetical protein N0V84_011912 [Fusarium piperis]|uniref:Uncharacterized protein n=1 Tax=Fusarium piperis TaxID=1435070 RepID=A0A9W8TB85_9HYPO|nr:hypothetical protein N0V84_011912 [Fusarium piperis]